MHLARRRAVCGLAGLVGLAAAVITVGLPSRPAQADDKNFDDEASRLEQLRALGYVDSAPTDNADLRGVTVLAPEAARGYTLVSSRQRARAQLIDLHGNILHTWQEKHGSPWMHVEMQRNGSLLALAKDRYLLKLDWHSTVLWRFDGRPHHDFHVDRRRRGKRRILLLGRTAKTATIEGFGRLPHLSGKIQVLSARGVLQREVELLPLLRPLIPRHRLRSLADKHKRGQPFARLTLPESAGDLLHANSIEVITKDIPGVAPVASVLLSVREIDRIVLLNPKMTAVLWSWRGPAKGDSLEGQHDASLLANGNISVFDNGVRRKRSRLLEIDPRSGKIAWRYSAPGFFSRLRGAMQRLPNGNTLATLSDSGQAVEITTDHKVVWQYWHPDVRQVDGRQTRAVIYRARRYPPGYLHRHLLTKAK